MPIYQEKLLPTAGALEVDKMDKVDKIVDEILTGDYKKVKLAEQAGDLVDVILDDCGEDHKKKKVKEIANTIDHVPDESAEGEHDKIKDQLGKDEKKVEENKIENALDSEPKQDGDEQLAAVEDEMSKEQSTKTESAVDLVKKAFKAVKEEKSMDPVYLVKKAFKGVREEKAI